MQVVSTLVKFEALLQLDMSLRALLEQFEITALLEVAYFLAWSTVNGSPSKCWPVDGKYTSSHTNWILSYQNMGHVRIFASLGRLQGA